MAFTPNVFLELNVCIKECLCFFLVIDRASEARILCRRYCAKLDLTRALVGVGAVEGTRQRFKFAFK
jgi:hypothetical protein